MRLLSDELKTHLQTGATTLCRCWLVIRKDGVDFGFTDHDKPLAFDGHSFEAATGMGAVALQSSTGLSVDNSEALGALSAQGLTEADIATGKYDGAEIWYWLVNWTDVVQRILQFRGFIGELGYAVDARAY